MKRRGLLMIELLIAMLIIALSAGAISLSPDLWNITAKREAEKLAAQINSLKLKANTIKTHFQLEMYVGQQRRITVQWNTSHNDVFHPNKEYIDASKGCYYSWNAPNYKLTYSYITNRMTPGATIAVTGKGPTYYVIIAAIGGRVRVSETKPSDL